MSLFRQCFFGQLEKCSALLSSKAINITYSQSRSSAYNKYKTPVPEPGIGRCFWRIVHYPKEYTVQPLKTTHLAGRDPVSGRKVVQGVGGGYKYKYHWIHWLRDGPVSGPPAVDKVIQILHDGNRSAPIALVANGDQLKYYLATENMKQGQLLETTREIPKNPVQPVEGNAYPLGSLPEGTLVNNVERMPGQGSAFVHAAGSSARIIKQNEHTTVLKMPSKHEFTFDRHCLAVVGRISNPKGSDHRYANITEWRMDGHRPRSGLFQKKSGRHGRKLKRPLQQTVTVTEPKAKPYNLTLNGNY